jgi:hypothetical protein
MTKDHLIAIRNELRELYVVNLCKVLYAKIELIAKESKELPRHGVVIYFDKGEKMVILEHSKDKAEETLLKLLEGKNDRT